jgi:3-hydroxyisobutyrate dehydrogenase/glyoxylate/succinic semialdehyde reductase
MKVTFIGLGIMGSRMATNLIKAGHEVLVWNRTTEKSEALKKSGAKVASSIADAVKEADVFITMLSSPEVVEKVALGKDGMVMHAKRNALWINTSTINPSFAEEMSSKAKEAGLRYLDAPVSGSKIPAEKGELIFLVGGDPADLEQAQPFLNAMGKSINYLGNVGSGSKMKLVVNLVLAQSMLAFSEAVALGVASGLDQSKIVDVILGGPVASPFLQMKKGKFESKNFEPEFPLKWVHKDLHLILQTAYENNIAMPLTSIAKEVYGLAKQNGRGEEDLSAIYDYLINKK